MNNNSPVWALAAAAAAAEEGDFSDEDSDLGSEEEEEANSYDQARQGNFYFNCNVRALIAFELECYVRDRHELIVRCWSHGVLQARLQSALLVLSLVGTRHDCFDARGGKRQRRSRNM